MNRFMMGSNPPSSTNKAKGHLRVAFCFIGEVAADAKHRSGFSRSLRSKRRQRPQGDQSPGHCRWPVHTALSKYATMSQAKSAIQQNLQMKLLHSVV
jgi:hypothetical protein